MEHPHVFYLITVMFRFFFANHRKGIFKVRKILPEKNRKNRDDFQVHLNCIKSLCYMLYNLKLIPYETIISQHLVSPALHITL